MPRGTPVVISGAKGPSSIPDDPSLLERAAAAGDAGAQAAIRSSLGMLARGESKIRTEDEQFVVFGSRFKGLTLQITSPEDTFNPLTGIRTRARPVKLKFKDYICQVSRKDPNFDLIMERAQQSPHFGIGQDFWLERDLSKAQADARYRSVVAAIKADPELMGRLVAEFKGGDDFELPSDPPPGNDGTPTVPPVSTVAELQEAEPDPGPLEGAKPQRRGKAKSLDEMSESELEAATAPA